MNWKNSHKKDMGQLALWNQQLQEDEGAQVMSLKDIINRMKNWFDSGWQAVLFETDGQKVGYILFAEADPNHYGPNGLYVQQFYIARNHRRKGYGKAAFQLFLNEIAPKGDRIILEGLLSNQGGQAFWDSLGFKAYSTIYHLE